MDGEILRADEVMQSSQASSEPNQSGAPDALANGVGIQPVAPKQLHRYSQKNREHADLGNALRLHDLFQPYFRYCQMWKCWLVWDGRRWHRDEGRELERAALKTALSILTEAAVSSEPKNFSRFATDSLNAPRIAGMIELAKSVFPQVLPSELDTDPWLLNCANGVVDLRKGQLLPHQPDRLITQLVPFKYDANATCPLWLKFLSDVTNQDKELMDYLQRLSGYALTGSVVEHVVAFFYGSGLNGKTTFCNVLQSVMGDYAKQMSPEMLLQKRFGSGPPCDVADLLTRPCPLVKPCSRSSWSSRRWSEN